MTKCHVILRTLKPKHKRPEQRLSEKKEQQAGPLKAPKQIRLDTQRLQQTVDFSFC